MNFVDPTGLAVYDPLVDWVSGQSLSDTIIGAGDAGLQFDADLAYTGVNGMTPWPARMFIPDEAPDIGSGLRSILGLDDQVDPCSEAYGNGQAGGNGALFVASLLAGGGGALARGQRGERTLRALVGGRPASFMTSRGWRCVDAFADGVAHESKVGYTAATRRILRQVAKDAELVNMWDRCARPTGTSSAAR